MSDSKQIVDRIEQAFAKLLGDKSGTRDETPTANASDEADALAQLADPSTHGRQVEHLLRQFPGSMAVPRAVARHPNCIRENWLVMCLFLPQDAAANPTHNIDGTQAPEVTQGYASEMREKGWDPLEYQWKRDWPNGYDVSHRRPQHYRVAWYLANGSPQAKRFVLALERLPLEFIPPFQTAREIPLRKTLAERKNLPQGGFEQLAKDSAKSVRQAVAANPAAPPPVLAVLTQDAEAGVRAAALANPSCPAEAAHAERQRAEIAAMPWDKPAAERTLDECRGALAHERTARAVLAEIGRHAEDWLRCAAALHVNAPAELLAGVAQDPIVWVRSGAAFNPATSPATLQALFETRDFDVWLGLACNPATPPDIQRRLVDEADDEVRRALADHTDNDRLLQALVDTRKPSADRKKNPGWEDLLEILLNPKTKASQINGLNQRHALSLGLARAAARHPNLSPELRNLWAHYAPEALALNPAVALALLENPNALQGKPYLEWKINHLFSGGRVSGLVTRSLLRAAELPQQRQAAGSTTVPATDALRLVFHPDTLVRKRLVGGRDSAVRDSAFIGAQRDFGQVQRRRLPRYVFEALARDSKEGIREEVARHALCPPDLLALLMQDPAGAVRAAASRHPAASAGARLMRVVGQVRQATTEEAVATLRNSGAKSKRVRMASEATQPSVLDDLSQDKAREVRQAVAGNPNLPPGAQQRLAADIREEVRLTLSKNESLDAAAGEILLRDVEAKIRAAALYGLYKQRRWRDGEVCNAQRDVWAVEAETLLAKFYDDPATEVRRVITHYSIDPAIQLTAFEAACAAGDESTLRSLASYDHISRALAERFATHADTGIRALFAERNSRFVDLHLRQLDDRDPLFSQSAEHNGWIADRDDARMRLASDPHPKCRCRAARGLKSGDAELIALLSVDPDPRVVAEVLNNQMLPIALRMTLIATAPLAAIRSMEIVSVGHGECELLGAISKRPDAQARLLAAASVGLNNDKALAHRLAKDPDVSVRAAIAANRSLPVGLRKHAGWNFEN